MKFSEPLDRANWLRLSLLLHGTKGPSGLAELLGALREYPAGSRYGLFPLPVPRAESKHVAGFDKTLGFPGEGPCCAPVIIVFCLSLNLNPCFAVLGPRNAADLQRQLTLSLQKV